MTDLDEAERRLREEWRIAPYRSQLTMTRLAASVRSDRVPAREHLETVMDALQDLDDELAEDTERGVVSARERLVLMNDVAIFLSERRGFQRPYDVRLREAQGRLDRGRRALPPDDPELWRLRIREAEARASLPEHRAQALDDIRALLAEAGYPGTWNFRLSLHAMNLAVRLRSDEDDAAAAVSTEILERELLRRTERYSAKHPYTLVARANLLLYALTRLELAADRGDLDDDQRDRARQLVIDARDLHTDRVAIFGERAGSATRALAHQARALRLCGEHEESRSLAAEAYALRGDDPDTQRDDEVPAILQILIASALSIRRQIALSNARYLATGIRQGQSVARDGAEKELARAEELRDDVHRRLDAAVDVLGHQVPYRRWVRRAERIRASVDGVALEETA